MWMEFKKYGYSLTLSLLYQESSSSFKTNHLFLQVVKDPETSSLFESQPLFTDISQI